MGKVDKLTGKFRREGEKTAAFLKGIGKDVWREQLYADGVQWSVMEVLAHIIESEGSHLLVIKNVLGGGDGVGQEYDIDGHNAVSTERFSSLNPEELIYAFEEQRQETIDFISSLTEDDLEIVGLNPFLGEATIYEMFRLIYLHINLHIRDVRSMLEDKREAHAD